MTISVVTNGGVNGCSSAVPSVEDCWTCSLGPGSGASVTLWMGGDDSGSFLIGFKANGLVFLLRAVIEEAVFYLSEGYAVDIGVALDEMDALDNSIREGAVYVHLIGSGGLMYVRICHLGDEFADRVTTVHERSSWSAHLCEVFANSVSTFHDLQANTIVCWKDVYRSVRIWDAGPGVVVSAEE